MKQDKLVHLLHVYIKTMINKLSHGDNFVRADGQLVKESHIVDFGQHTFQALTPTSLTFQYGLSIMVLELGPFMPHSFACLSVSLLVIFFKHPHNRPFFPLGYM